MFLSLLLKEWKIAAAKQMIREMHQERFLVKTLTELRIKQYFNLWKEETHNKMECPLCITRVPKEGCYTTDCGHTFCNDCIGTWKQQCFNKATDATCPICREVFDYRPIVYSTPVPQREEQLLTETGRFLPYMVWGQAINN